jgi:hypothetical protein
MKANVNSSQGRTRPAAVGCIFTSHRRVSRHVQASTGITRTPCQPSSSFFKSPPELYRLNCRQATALGGFKQGERQCTRAYRDPTAE